MEITVIYLAISCCYALSGIVVLMQTSIQGFCASLSVACKKFFDSGKLKGVLC